jgi:hypothetical protein
LKRGVTGYRLDQVENAVSAGIARLLRVKFRLVDTFEAMEAGGYRDILMNMAFPPNDHIAELQINLEKIRRHQKWWRTRKLHSRAHAASV